MHITETDCTALELISKLLTYAGTFGATNCTTDEIVHDDIDTLIDAFKTRLDRALSFLSVSRSSSCSSAPQMNGEDLLFNVRVAGNLRRIAVHITHSDRQTPSIVSFKGLQPADTAEPPAAISTQVDERWGFSLDAYRSTGERAYACTQGAAVDISEFPLVKFDGGYTNALLRLSLAEIDAFCISLLCRRDTVLEEARKEAKGLNRSALCLVIDTIVDSIHGGQEVLSADIIDSIFDNGGDATVIELEEKGYLIGQPDGVYRINFMQFRGIAAVMIEGLVRYGHEKDQAEIFVARLVL